MSDYLEEETFDCPYCAAPNSLTVDHTGGRKQTFTTDCEVCCHPMVVTLEVNEEGVLELDVQRESD